MDRQSLSQRARRYVIGWMAFALACGAAYSFKVWQNHALHARALAHEKAYRAAVAEARRAPSPMPAALNVALLAWASGRPPAPTTQVVANLINGGRPVAESIPGEMSWYWTDPATYITWRLQFHDDVLVGYASVHQAPPANLLPPPAPPLWYAEVERATTSLIVHGWRVGLIVGLATLLTLPLRRAAPLAHVLLAVAAVCLLAGIMPLKASTLFVQPSFVDRASAILLMVGVAVVALAVHHRPPRRTPGETPKCDACGYDLTGNVSGICPECGAAAAAAGVTAAMAGRADDAGAAAPPPVRRA